MGWHRLEGTQAMVTDAPAVKATGGVDGWAASQMALRDEWQARVSALRKLERVSRNLARLRNLAQRVRLPAGLTAEVVADCSGCLRRSAAWGRGECPKMSHFHGPGAIAKQSGTMAGVL